MNSLQYSQGYTFLTFSSTHSTFSLLIGFFSLNSLSFFYPFKSYPAIKVDSISTLYNKACTLAFTISYPHLHYAALLSCTLLTHCLSRYVSKIIFSICFTFPLTLIGSGSEKEKKVHFICPSNDLKNAKHITIVQ